MIWIFPMAGRGDRTSQLGEFKPFINVEGKEIIEWLMMGIKSNLQNSDTLIFITTKHFENKLSVSNRIDELLKKNNISVKGRIHISIDEVLEGPAKTIYEAKEHLQTTEDVTICNTDQFVVFEMPRNYLDDNHVGYIPIYLSRNEKSSFVKMKESNGKIESLVEKKVISNYASAGIYNFRSGAFLLKALEALFANNVKTNNEFYIGPSINYLITEEAYFTPIFVQIKYNLGDIPSIDRFRKFINTIV